MTPASQLLGFHLYALQVVQLNPAFTVSQDMRKVYIQRAACIESSLLADTQGSGVC